MSTTARFTTFHFSQANPKDAPDVTSVPALLRRVAGTIEEMGDIEIQDLVMHTEITAEGIWPSLTVYYSDKATDS